MEPHENGPHSNRGKRRKSLAIQALAFIAEEPERLAAFLAATGIDPPAIRAAAREPRFLAGVLEHMLGDESLLLAFADSAGIDPADRRASARGALGGDLGARRAVSTSFCRDCLDRRRAARPRAAPPAARRACCATTSLRRSPSPMSIATPSTPRSRSATIRRSPPSRSSSAAASAAWWRPAATSPAPSA